MCCLGLFDVDKKTKTTFQSQIKCILLYLELEYQNTICDFDCFFIDIQQETQTSIKGVGGM